MTCALYERILDMRLKPALQIALLHMVRHAEPDGRVRLTQTELAAFCGVTPRALRDHLAALEALKLIASQRDTVHGRFAERSYTIAPGEHFSAGPEEHYSAGVAAPEEQSAQPQGAQGEPPEEHSSAGPKEHSSAGDPAPLSPPSSFPPTPPILTTPLNPPTPDPCDPASQAHSPTVDLLGDDPPSTPKPKAKPKGPAYTPEFAVFWEAWPPRRRRVSDKPAAFRRWQTACEQWDAKTIMGAAAMYLSQPDVRKEDWRYCRLAEVFLNGGLEASVEAFQAHASATPKIAPDELAAAVCRHRERTGTWREGWGPEQIPDGVRSQFPALFSGGMAR